MKVRRISSALLFFALSCLLLPQHSYAQFETATVLGTVRDVNGANIPNANVTLKNIATGISSTAATNETGDYQFVNVKIGTYQVTVEAQGFSTALAENVSVTVNARQRVDLVMQAGVLTET
ncbi:MAG: carboxypeptidase regulatory-like domain-containing protein, partial [Pyrinomonadaceae bacterium]|nr:carboxypeptidase regulatory-like domain-containing protein [Pyrinomonadaceae bacterium]